MKLNEWYLNNTYDHKQFKVKELLKLKKKKGLKISLCFPTLNEGKTIRKILDIVNDGAKLLRIKKKYNLSDIPLIRDYSKAGYGVITEMEKNAIRKLAETEGILLDPLYTARAFGGMLDYLANRKMKINSNVLFWHTGGFPEIFEHANELN